MKILKLILSLIMIFVLQSFVSKNASAQICWYNHPNCAGGNCWNQRYITSMQGCNASCEPNWVGSTVTCDCLFCEVALAGQYCDTSTCQSTYTFGYILGCCDGDGGGEPGGCDGCYQHYDTVCGGHDCPPNMRAKWKECVMDDGSSCDPHYIDWDCDPDEMCAPSPTPTPACPVCTSFSDVYINNCTPIGNYSPVIQPVCKTTNSAATLNLNYPNCATTVQYLEDVNPATGCTDASLNWSSAPVITSNTQSISLNNGINKACVRYQGNTLDMRCGGMIELLTPTPTNTPTPTSTPTCTANLITTPAAWTGVVGGAPQTFVANPTRSPVRADCNVNRVDFGCANTSVCTVNPASDTTSPYQSNATCVGQGSTTLTSTLYLNNGGGADASDTSSITCNCPAVPTVNISLSHTPPVYQCEIYNVVWSSAGATSCNVTRNGSAWRTGLSGNQQDSQTVTGDYIYQATCVNACNQPSSASVTETVVANTADITCSTTAVNMCEGFTCSWTSEGASNCEVRRDPGNVWVANGTSGTSPLQSFTSPGLRTYNLSCDTACVANTTDSTTVNVRTMTAYITPPAANPHMCSDYAFGWSARSCATPGTCSCTLSQNGTTICTGNENGPSSICADDEYPAGIYPYNLSCNIVGCGSAPATDTKTVTVDPIYCSLYVNPSSLLNVPVGSANRITPIPTVHGGTVDEVDFLVPPPGGGTPSIARICDISTYPSLCGTSEDNFYLDTTSPFGSNVSIVNHNSTSGNLLVNSRMTDECSEFNNNPVCNGSGPCFVACPQVSIPITLDYTQMWFQTEWGNVVAQGGVTSNIPATAHSLYFISRMSDLESVGFLTSTSVPSFASGSVSPSGISAQASVTTVPQSSFDLFYNSKLPGDVRSNITEITGDNEIELSELGDCNPTRGFKVCHYDGSMGDLVINNSTNYLIPDGDRIILFVEERGVVIGGRITPVTRGRSSFLLISEGNISVDYSVGGLFADDTPELEGLFYTDGSFSTGHDAQFFTDNNLHIRGAVVANNLVLERDLGGAENNEIYPGEYFTYGFEQVLAFPPFLRLRPTYWQEVNP